MKKSIKKSKSIKQKKSILQLRNAPNVTVIEKKGALRLIGGGVIVGSGGLSIVD